MFAAVRAGTRGGLLMVPTGPKVAAIAGGRRFLPTDCAQMMIDFLAARRRRRGPPGFDELTAREHEVRSGCAGYNNADVALVFVLSPKPVRTMSQTRSRNCMSPDRSCAR
jgi:DNA-binding NarL/FixJ family response regulator